MKLEFEYGQGLLGAELPDSTDIFIPGPASRLVQATLMQSAPPCK